MVFMYGYRRMEAFRRRPEKGAVNPSRSVQLLCQVMLMAAERQQQRTLGPYYVISANASWLQDHQQLKLSPG